MALFKNKTSPQISERDRLEQRYRSARGNLLIVLIFTAINMGLLITKQFTYFLFSAYVPYLITDIGMAMSGQYPAEYYTGDFADAAMFGKNFFYIMLAVAVIILIVYLTCWIFSKDKKSGWIVFALVLFSIDTVLMLLLNGIASNMIFDLLFHAWVIYDLVNGIIAAKKLKKLPVEAPEITGTEENEFLPQQDSVHIRYADMEAKNRVFLETDVEGHKVVYRRVGKTNELVIDGRVYDEFVGLVEPAHSLEARIDGHHIEAGFDGSIHVYINVDGTEVLKKTRLI